MGDPAWQLVLVAELGDPAQRLVIVAELGDPARRLVIVAELGDPSWRLVLATKRGHPAGRLVPFDAGELGDQSRGATWLNGWTRVGQSPLGLLFQAVNV
ncbi:hypothetical protein PCASD_02078 [Puccinia coronata f. sp. avenae]|uniref:Uncharacterized protein n=1 Tax=Puccinia coronata f. sp. avenae TaxID=200324 RepID=A0A2N5VQ85_9BASI|nr:hypothetical protein PCASD_11591 [Puccinia coronata f. sp. avenae]PLW52132.1 hypothetical protein PCASD_02078 [Puccinia coronata f. sp. avenae]